MARTVFIFHGTGGSPQDNWFPWLKQELEKNKYVIFIPQFPNPGTPLLKPWLAELQKYADQINEHTILIGHSIGGLFLLRVLERLEKPVRAAIFVAPSAGIKPIKFYGGDSRFSDGFSFDWNKIKSNAKQFAVFHSDNDPYISLANGQEVAKQLDITLTFIPKAGHFNTASGYTQFPALLDTIHAFE